MLGSGAMPPSDSLVAHQSNRSKKNSGDDKDNKKEQLPVGRKHKAAHSSPSLLEPQAGSRKERRKTSSSINTSQTKSRSDSTTASTSTSRTHSSRRSRRSSSGGKQDTKALATVKHDDFKAKLDSIDLTNTKAISQLIFREAIVELVILQTNTSPIAKSHEVIKDQAEKLKESLLYSLMKNRYKRKNVIHLHVIFNTLMEMKDLRPYKQLKRHNIPPSALLGTMALFFSTLQTGDGEGWLAENTQRFYVEFADFNNASKLSTTHHLGTGNSEDIVDRLISHLYPLPYLGTTPQEFIRRITALTQFELIRQVYTDDIDTLDTKIRKQLIKKALLYFNWILYFTYQLALNNSVVKWPGIKAIIAIRGMEEIKVNTHKTKQIYLEALLNSQLELFHSASPKHLLQKKIKSSTPTFSIALVLNNKNTVVAIIVKIKLGFNKDGSEKFIEQVYLLVEIVTDPTTIPATDFNKTKHLAVKLTKVAPGFISVIRAEPMLQREIFSMLQHEKRKHQFSCKIFSAVIYQQEILLTTIVKKVALMLTNGAEVSEKDMYINKLRSLDIYDAAYLSRLDEVEYVLYVTPQDRYVSSWAEDNHATKAKNPKHSNERETMGKLSNEMQQALDNLAEPFKWAWKVFQNLCYQPTSAVNLDDDIDDEFAEDEDLVDDIDFSDTLYLIKRALLTNEDESVILHLLILLKNALMTIIKNNDLDNAIKKIYGELNPLLEKKSETLKADLEKTLNPGMDPKLAVDAVLKKLFNTPLCFRYDNEQYQQYVTRKVWSLFNDIERRERKEILNQFDKHLIDTDPESAKIYKSHGLEHRKIKALFQAYVLLNVKKIYSKIDSPFVSLHAIAKPTQQVMLLKFCNHTLAKTKNSQVIPGTFLYTKSAVVDQKEAKIVDRDAKQKDSKAKTITLDLGK